MYKLLSCFFILCMFKTHAEVQGLNHVGLTVSSLAESEDFFVNHAGLRVVGRDSSYPSTFLSNNDIMITLWQVSSPEKYVEFDRKKNVGLHHLAFNVDTVESLHQLFKRLQKDPLVKIEFAPEPLGYGPVMHMMVYEPSGNRIEFIHKPAR